jgi:fructose-1,6-bisphosphatase
VAGKIYSFNEANYFDWDENLQKYVDNMKKVSSHQQSTAAWGSPAEGPHVATCLWMGS